MGVWSFDLKGKQTWNAPLEANPIYLDFGTGSSPALAGNLVVIVADNEKQQYIAGYDKQTGKQVWRNESRLADRDNKAALRWARPYIWQHPFCAPKSHD
jgi:glucose dehydrogenase